MSVPVVYPLNDFAFIATIKVANTAGALVPLTTGTPTAFMAISDSPTATAADASLITVPTYTGAGGKWLVAFDAAQLTPTLLATLFGTRAPYVIIQFPNAVRIVVKCAYSPVRTVQPV
jgi:hypothetical protein